MLNLSGQGEKQTDTFHVGDTWTVAWTCQAPADVVAAAGKVPFYANVLNSDGSATFSGDVSYSCGASKSGDKTTEHGARAFYLHIISGSDVSWTITVTEMPS